ncbi:MAG TPA: DUF4157 domain-containing protein [Pseudonocardiaceae bacterium]|nr:DUF4157 domain-containing protein [Pseudonocardiaceae bacterium]
MAWVLDGDIDLPDAHVERGQLPTVEDRPDVDTSWLDEPAGSAPAPRQVVTPNPPSRRLGLGAPIAGRPVRRPVPDLSDVTVHRGPAVNEQARAMRARAFTRDGEVYLPDDHDHRAEQATLAHELIHVVQQRTMGDSLPPEWSAAGQALEQDAVAAAPPPQPHYEPPAPQHQQPAPVLVPAGVQRDPDPTVITFPTLPGYEPRPEPAEPGPDQLAEYRDQLIALCGKRTVDLDDSRSIGELATKLYHPLRGLLRSELIVDRERAGLLTDFR